LAKRGRDKSTLDTTAESLGAALGQVAARFDRWRNDRAAIAADLQRLLKTAQGMLGSLDDGPGGEPIAAPPPPKNKRKGGRPKGYKMSDATKQKLRAAWKRRMAASKKPATSPAREKEVE
jgi:hypothetical protein